MIINTNSWHFRWYAYWLGTGRGVQPGYRENLCHYVRVLLFWAPMTWLDQHTSWNWGKLAERITLGGLVLTILALIGYGVVTAAITQPTKSLMAIGSLGGLLVVTGLVVLGVKTRRGKPLEVPGTLKLVGGYVVAKKRRVCPFLTFEG